MLLGSKTVVFSVTACIADTLLSHLEVAAEDAKAAIGALHIFHDGQEEAVAWCLLEVWTKAVDKLR